MAAIEIDSLNKLISFFNGDYGQGTSSAFLDVELTTDLDFAEMSGYSFAGSTNAPSDDWYVNFEGNNHSISNITYTSGTAWFLFTNLRNGYIQNLNLLDMYIVVTDRASLTRNIYNNAIISNVHMTGQMVGNECVAPFSLYFNASSNKVISCSFSGKLSAKNVGGIVYSRSSSPVSFISSCCCIGEIEATVQGAGITLTSCRVINSFFRGTIKSPKVYPLSNQANYCSYCYVVLNDGTTDAVQNVGQNLCYYDSTEAAAANITVTGLTDLTTAQLKNAQYMKGLGFAI